MPRQKIDGILILDKPKGISSNAALQKAKQLFQAKKAGHTGSLDPAASGLLPICFGEATKYSQYLLDSDKAYVCQAQLGTRTTTSDSEGDIIETQAVDGIDLQLIEPIIQRFMGSIQQIPTMYSALKHQGQPLYKLARKGIEVERKPRKVHVYEIGCLSYRAPYLQLKVRCSKGTYIRTLVEDIGQQLGCGAYVKELRRTDVGAFRQASMITFKQLAEMRDPRQCLHPVEVATMHFDPVEITLQQYGALAQGQRLPQPTGDTLITVRVQVPTLGFVGLAELSPHGLSAKRLLATN